MIGVHISVSASSEESMAWEACKHTPFFDLGCTFKDELGNEVIVLPVEFCRDISSITDVGRISLAWKG